MLGRPRIQIPVVAEETCKPHYLRPFQIAYLPFLQLNTGIDAIKFHRHECDTVVSQYALTFILGYQM